jgi:hypothetical protein
VDCSTSALFPDEVEPPMLANAMPAFPPSPPLPPFPLPVALPPVDDDELSADEPEFPLRALSVLDPPPPAAPNEWLPLVVLVDVDVAVELGDDAPPVDVDVAVPVAAPPAPAVVEAESEPAPPAPPVRLSVTVLIAELVCDSELEVVLVLLPEFDPDEEFVCVLLPPFESSPNAPATTPRASTATAARKNECTLLT